MGGSVFFFFLPQRFDVVRPKYPKKKQRNIWQKETKKKTIRQRLGRGSSNTRAKVQGLTSKKMVSTLDSEQFLGLYA